MEYIIYYLVFNIVFISITEYIAYKKEIPSPMLMIFFGLITSLAWLKLKNFLIFLISFILNPIFIIMILYQNLQFNKPVLERPTNSYEGYDFEISDHRTFLNFINFLKKNNIKYNHKYLKNIIKSSFISSLRRYCSVILISNLRTKKIHKKEFNFKKEFPIILAQELEIPVEQIINENELFDSLELDYKNWLIVNPDITMVYEKYDHFDIIYDEENDKLYITSNEDYSLQRDIKIEKIQIEDFLND